MLVVVAVGRSPGPEAIGDSNHCAVLVAPTDTPGLAAVCVPSVLVAPALGMVVGASSCGDLGAHTTSQCAGAMGDSAIVH